MIKEKTKTTPCGKCLQTSIKCANGKKTYLDVAGDVRGLGHLGRLGQVERARSRGARCAAGAGAERPGWHRLGRAGRSRGRGRVGRSRSRRGRGRGARCVARAGPGRSGWHRPGREGRGRVG
jgi:hypothetical protein